MTTNNTLQMHKTVEKNSAHTNPTIGNLFRQEQGQSMKQDSMSQTFLVQDSKSKSVIKKETFSKQKPAKVKFGKKPLAKIQSGKEQPKKQKSVKNQFSEQKSETKNSTLSQSKQPEKQTKTLPVLLPPPIRPPEEVPAPPKSPVVPARKPQKPSERPRRDMTPQRNDRPKPAAVSSWRKRNEKKEEKKEEKTKENVVVKPRPNPFDKLERRHIRALGRRKKATAVVNLTKGRGRIKINHQPALDYMQTNPIFMKRLLKPLELMALTDRVKISIFVHGGGLAGQADAIKLAISRAICKYDMQFRPVLKEQGFLTRDARIKERKKYGLKKARKAPQYSKR